MDYGALYGKMLVFFLLICLGYFTAKKGIATPAFIQSASRLLMDVFIVATIINSVLGEKPAIRKDMLLHAVLILTLTTLIIYAVSAVVSRTVFRGQANAPQAEILLAVVNALFVGLPIAQAVCGREGVLYLGMNTIPFFLFLYSYGILRLKGKANPSGIAVREMITSPPLLAALLALLIFFLDLPVPGVVSEFCAMLAAVTSPLSLMIIGGTIGDLRPGPFLKDWNVWFLCFVRLILTPVIVWLLLSLLSTERTLLIVCVIIAATPPGVVCTPLSVQYGYDPEFSSKLIMLSTLASMVTIPSLIQILF